MNHDKLAEGALATTAVTIPMAWLAEVDVILRIVLTLVGIVSGCYAALYYRRKWKE